MRDGIYEILRTALSLEPPHPDTDLIEANLLDSLAIITLVVELEQRFSISLPLDRLELSMLRTISTLEELVINEANPPDPPPINEASPPAQPDSANVQLLRSGSDENPVFLLPGAWGKAFAMLPLARALSTTGPVYALQTYGGEKDADQARTVEMIAERTLEAILAADSAGPFTLVGYSFGGQVAFEVACMLHARGRSVRLLALIDTRISPASLSRAGHLRVMSPQPLRYARYILANPRARVPQTVRKLKRLLRARRADPAQLVPSPLAPELDPSMRRLAAAARSYRPARYPGAAALLVSDRTHPLVRSGVAVWRDRIEGTLTVTETPGEHGRIISTSTEAVAESINRLLGQTPG